MRKNISFRSNKGYLLRGVLQIPPGRGPFPTVIVQHGFRYNHNTNFIRSIAKGLSEKGFIVLRFSFSGHKPSGGTYKEVLISQFINDIDKARKYLFKIPQVDQQRLGIIGYSMGGFASLMAANKYGEDFKSIVSISSLYDVEAVLKSYYYDQKIEESNKDFYKISGFKITAKHFDDRLYLKKKFLLSKIHCPALIIHGDQDRRVQVQDAYSIYNLLAGPKKLLIIKGAGHNFENPLVVKRAVKSTVDWFKKYLAFKASQK